MDPSTPERDRQAERNRERQLRLQMTSPRDRHNRLPLTHNGSPPPLTFTRNQPAPSVPIQNFASIVVPPAPRPLRRYNVRHRNANSHRSASPPPSPQPPPSPSPPPPPPVNAAAHLPNAKARQPYDIEPAHHSLGNFKNIAWQCRHCKAYHWKEEKLSNSTLHEPKYGMCCLQGQVKLDPLTPPPIELQKLLSDNTVEAKFFRQHIRQYNAALSMTSLGVEVDQSVTSGSGPYCFRIHGELSHKHGALLPDYGQAPRYAQLYIHDPNEALDHRLNANHNLGQHRSVMADLQDMLDHHHPFIPLYKQAHTILSEKPPHEAQNLHVVLRLKEGTDQRRYNLPTINELAAVIPGDGTEVRSDHRDIILRLRGGGLKRISQLNASYAPLHYVLLFPRGELGWHMHMQLQNVSDRTRQRLTMAKHHCYRLFPRATEPNVTLFQAGRLFQQYVVDNWTSNEQNRLNWVRHNQKSLRSDLAQGLADTIISGDTDLNDVGTHIILPSSHPGSPRHMYQLFQDSMAICRLIGKPDLFITMTADPRWPEILEALLRPDGTYQPVEERPDIVARVFELKKRALLKEIKNGLFGPCKATIYTIEFQKRGLPHMHLLIFLSPEAKIRTPADVDTVCSAQLPDPVTQPELYRVVTKCMLHGPCGPAFSNAPCMKDGKCSKGYPKNFCEQTALHENGYPEVARPDNGRTFSKPGCDYVFTNRDVVPYNAHVLAKYGCHINTECCVSIKSVKYIHKYIYKGHDRTTMEFRVDDEIKQYLDARYISAIEGAWRLFEFSMHGEEPNVVRLQVHLPKQQTVVYDPNTPVEDILERTEKDTTLTGWFKFNEKRVVDLNDQAAVEAEETRLQMAHSLTYQDFPAQFVWQKKIGQWKVRERRASKVGDTIGRMWSASPSSGERFYLRLLLTVVKGAISFENLRTVNDVVQPTFQAACLALGLLENDNEWRSCLEEASVMKTGFQLRNLFSTILLFCNPSQPNILWHEFKAHICDDLAYKLRTLNILDPTEDQIFDFGLYLINKNLGLQAKSLQHFPPMPLSTGQWDEIIGNTLIAEQRNYDPLAQAIIAQQNQDKFNNEQEAAFDQVTMSVDQHQGGLFFLHSAGGCGKTFVFNTLAAYYRSQGKIVLCVASSGIASIILAGGRTSHSRFKIPIPALEDSSCSFRKTSDLAELLRATSLIIWDEVPMQHRFCIEAVDRSLKDICNSDQFFGGITTVFGGDFRQTTPVIPKGSREQIVGASLCRSPLWPQIKVFYFFSNFFKNKNSCLYRYYS